MVLLLLLLSLLSLLLLLLLLLLFVIVVVLFVVAIVAVIVITVIVIIVSIGKQTNNDNSCFFNGVLKERHMAKCQPSATNDKRTTATVKAIKGEIINKPHY